jgi:protein SCO1/2
MARMLHRFPFLVFGLLAWASVPAAAAAETAKPDPFDRNAAIAYSQGALGRALDDYAFVDSEGGAVRLSDYRDKPLVVNMVFTACAQSCPIVVQTLRDAVEVAQDALGRDAFSVVTVGFDAGNDTPARLRAFARAQGVDAPNWRFLSGDRSTVERLAETLGFIYFPSPRGFDHLAQTTVIDAQGRVYRQVYGAQFTAPALVEPLLELTFGRPSETGLLADIVNRVRLFCTYYDPAGERYRFDYSIFIAFAVGAASLIGLGTILVRAWLRTRPNARNA